MKLSCVVGIGAFVLFVSVSSTLIWGQVPKAVAVAIGLNSVDPNHYAGWSGPLVACEFDANDMEAIAVREGFQVRKFLTANATREAVLGELKAQARALPADGVLVVSYSGHGGQVRDGNGDEADGKDETWCLFDGEVIDDELAEIWSEFQPGVRVVVYSDSCHSGTVTKFKSTDILVGAVGFDGEETRAFREKTSDFLAATNTDAENASVKSRNDTPSPFRAMPDDIAEKTYAKNKAFYDKIGKDSQTEAKSRTTVKATVMLISGCQDNQLSADGTNNGLFTGTLKLVWNNGGFTKGYREFHSEIQAMMPPYQSPNFYVFGTWNPTFEDQRPYTK